jgi:gas vesicle protein
VISLNTGSFVKGMVTGAVIGMGISMVANPIDERDRRRIAKKTSKLFTTIGSIADNVIDVMK